MRGTLALVKAVMALCGRGLLLLPGAAVPFRELAAAHQALVDLPLFHALASAHQAVQGLQPFSPSAIADGCLTSAKAEQYPSSPGSISLISTLRL